MRDPPIAAPIGDRREVWPLLLSQGYTIVLVATGHLLFLQALAMNILDMAFVSLTAVFLFCSTWHAFSIRAKEFAGIAVTILLSFIGIGFFVGPRLIALCGKGMPAWAAVEAQLSELWTNTGLVGLCGYLLVMPGIPIFSAFRSGNFKRWWLLHMVMPAQNATFAFMVVAMVIAPFGDSLAKASDSVDTAAHSVALGLLACARALLVWLFLTRTTTAKFDEMVTSFSRGEDLGL